MSSFITDKSHPDYNEDNDPTFSYHKDWSGAIYPQEVEDDMNRVLSGVNPYLRPLSTFGNYHYHSKYWQLMRETKQKQREEYLNNMFKKTQNPFEYKQELKRGSVFNVWTPVGGILGISGAAAVVYVLRFLK